jgi:acyl carrier protein
MTDEAAIQAAVFSAIDTLNQTMAADQQVRLDLETALTGLESLAVTNLLVAIEDAVRDRVHAEISMTDEDTLDRLLSEEATPLRTVRTLVEYVGRLVDEAGS